MGNISYSFVKRSVHACRIFFSSRQNLWYIVLVTAVIYMFLHIELRLGTQYAPETVLIRPPVHSEATTAAPECFADIASESNSVRNKPLRALESIYDAIDPGFFFATNETGYYLLDTGFSRYQGDFEIRITCSVPDTDGHAYMVINEENDRCNIDRSGRILLC